MAALRLMAADGQSFGLLPGEYTISVGGAPPGINGLFVKSSVAIDDETPQTLPLTLV